MRRSAFMLALVALACACAGGDGNKRDRTGDDAARGKHGAGEEGEDSGASTRVPKFHVTAIVPDKARFVPVEGMTFVLASGPTLLDIQGDRVIYDGRKTAGMEKPFDNYGEGDIVTLMGRWPDNLWLALNLPPSVGGSLLYQWGDEGWTEKGPSKWRVIDSTRWTGESVLVLVERGDRGETKLFQSPKSDDKPPSFTDADGKCRLIGRRVRGFPSGEVLVQGDPCESGPPVYASWRAGDEKGEVAPLPAIDEDNMGVYAMSARSFDEVYFAGWTGPDENHPRGAYLARFTGKGARVEKLPAKLPLRDVMAAPDGSLWVIEGDKTSGKLWRRTTRNQWSQVPLPNDDGDLNPQRVWVRAGGDIWLVAQAGRRTLVLHTKESDAAQEIPRTSISEYQSLKPAQERCHPLLVILGKAKAVDENAVRNILGKEGGRQLVIEYRRRGEMYLGAIGYTLPLAERIAKAIQAGIPNTTPEIACHEPRHKRRQLILDPKTGRWQAHQL